MCVCSGPWIDKVLSDMLDKAAGTDDVSASKLFMYSAVSVVISMYTSGGCACLTALMCVCVV